MDSLDLHWLITGSGKVSIVRTDRRCVKIPGNALDVRRNQDGRSREL